MALLQAPLQSGEMEQWIDGLSRLPTYTIGRRADNAISIPNTKVSGQHARLIRCTDHLFVLEDLDSKNGTFVNDSRITRKIIDRNDRVRLADANYTVEELLELLQPESAPPAKAEVKAIFVPKTGSVSEKPDLDFRQEFADLQQVFEQYPKLRKACRNREKMIRTGSVILSSLVGISAVLTTGGGAVPFIQIMSSAGLSVLIPTLCSTLLSTDEKLEIIEKEYRERYRCPNPRCHDPFGNREWKVLAQQKTCRRCQALWAS